MKRVVLVCALLIMVAFLASCGPKARITFNPDGGSLETSEVADALRGLDVPAAAGASVDQAADLRNRSIADLRSRGGDEAELADLLTTQFPADTRSVPYYAAEAIVDGSPAWIIGEVWGPENGTMDKYRVWAFDRETGAVIVTAAAN